MEETLEPLLWKDSTMTSVRQKRPLPDFLSPKNTISHRLKSGNRVLGSLPAAGPIFYAVAAIASFWASLIVLESDQTLVAPSPQARPGIVKLAASSIRVTSSRAADMAYPWRSGISSLTGGRSFPQYSKIGFPMLVLLATGRDVKWAGLAHNRTV